MKRRKGRLKLRVGFYTYLAEEESKKSNKYYLERCKEIYKDKVRSSISLDKNVRQLN
jgi:hypothetical protein